MSRPVLHRDDPAKDPLVGNIKVTRQDWLNLALDVLISDGVAAVKVAALAGKLGVSRSSFYWYFRSRQDMLDALLDHWRHTNTAALVARARAPSDTITRAVCNVFRLVVNARLFDNRLDFAVRAWARQSGAVRRVLDQSDSQRLEALTQMFVRHGYEQIEAVTRARVLYFMQIGYNDAELAEPTADRLRLVPSYLLCFTGKTADSAEVEEYAAYVASVPAADRQ